MASNNSSSSPAHLSFAGNLTPEDIQELLGAMSGENQAARTDTTVSSSAQANADEVHRGSSDPETIVSPREESKVQKCVNQTRDNGSAGCGLPKHAHGSIDANEDAKEISGDFKAQARSERKRSREKQRRSDVNKQFADLTQLMRQIEAEESEDEAVKRRLSFNPTNRVDLIARTIFHLERLHDANKKRKTEVDSLKKELEQAKKAGEETASKLKEAMSNNSNTPNKQQFMMMVPMMMSPDGMSGSAMPMMNPYMAQQAFMPMPNAQAPQAAMIQPPLLPQQPQQPPHPQHQTPQQPQQQQPHHPQQQPQQPTLQQPLQQPQPQQPQATAQQQAASLQASTSTQPVPSNPAIHVAQTPMQQAPTPTTFPSVPMVFPQTTHNLFQQQPSMPYMMPAPVPNMNPMMTVSNTQLVPVATHATAPSHHPQSPPSNQTANNNSTGNSSDSAGSNNTNPPSGQGKSSSGMNGGGSNLAHCA